MESLEHNNTPTGGLILKVTKYASPDTNDVVCQLKMELETLRQRLNILDGGATKTELIDFLNEKESDLSEKNTQISIMTDKTERTVLRKSNTDLESEIKKVERNLSIREKEISSLAKRCAVQEEKLIGGKKHRIVIANLVEEVKDLKSQIKKRDKEFGNMESLSNRLNLREEENSKALLKINELKMEKKKHTDDYLVMTTSLKKQLANEKEAVEAMTKNMKRYKEERTFENKDQCKKIEQLEAYLAESLLKETQIRNNLHNHEIGADIMQKDMDKIRTQNKGLDKLRKEMIEEIFIAERTFNKTVSRLETEKADQNSSFQSVIESKNKSITESLKANASLKDENENFRKHLERESKDKKEIAQQCSKDAEILEEVKQAHFSVLKGKCDEIVKLQFLLDGNACQIASHTEYISELKVKVSELEGVSLKNTYLEQQLSNLNNIKFQSSEVIEQLRQNVCDCEARKNEMVMKYRQKMLTMEAERNKISNESQIQLVECHVIINNLTDELTSAKKDITKNRKEIDNLHADFDDHRNKCQLEINEVEKNLQSVHIRLLKKEEDMNNIKNGPLKESQEMVITLNDNISTLKNKVQRTEIEAAELVLGLNEKLEKAKNQCVALETQKSTELVNLSVSVDGLNAKLSNLSADSMKLQQEIKVKDVQLKECALTISSMTKVKSEQDKKELELKSERVMLINASDKLKEEHSQKITFLERDLKQQCSCAYDEAIAFHKDYEKLQNIAMHAESELEEKQIVLKNSKAFLDDKMKIFSEITMQNEHLEEDLLEARSLVTEFQQYSENHLLEKKEAEVTMQNEHLEKDLLEARSLVTKFQQYSENHLLEKKEAEADLQKLKQTLVIVEEFHMHEIQNEYTLRQNLTFEVEEMKASLEAAHKVCKTIPKLKENVKELKKKMEWQNKFLERKIQNEEKLKERMSLSSVIMTEMTGSEMCNKEFREDITNIYTPSSSNLTPTNHVVV